MISHLNLSIPLLTVTAAGESLAADDCRTVTTQGNLFLSGMSDSLEGLYTLVVQNTAGATARSIFISVGG